MAYYDPTYTPMAPESKQRRDAIINYLASCEGAWATVGSIADALGIAPQTVRDRMRFLEKEGTVIVDEYKEGRTRGKRYKLWEVQINGHGQ